MEHSLQAQAERAPWIADDNPGSGFIYRRCADHVRAVLGLTPFEVLALLTQDEWRSMLQDAYRELVALGEIIPPKENGNGEG